MDGERFATYDSYQGDLIRFDTRDTLAQNFIVSGNFINFSFGAWFQLTINSTWNNDHTVMTEDLEFMLDILNVSVRSS